MINPYLDRRDFRAVVFRGKGLEVIDDVVALFGQELHISRNSGSGSRIAGGTVTAVRATYYSTNCFLRTADPIKREAVRARKKELFQYEIYVLSFTKSARATFLVAIPFSSMAREFFGKIHQRKLSSDFVYLKPTIEQLIVSLTRRFAGSERIKTAGVNWAIAGDTGRSDQVVLRGGDVIHSAMFKHLQNTASGLALKTRKVLLRYEAPGGLETLKIGFDKFGNYSVWVRAEGENLPITFLLLDLLQRAKLIQEEPAFPVRNRDDEPIEP